MRLIDHRVRRRRHLPQMHDRLGLEFLKAAFDELVIGQIANAKIKLGASLPLFESLR